MALAQLSDLKTAVNVTGTDKDAELTRVLNAAAAQFLDDTGRTEAELGDPVPANVTNGVLALAIFLYVSAPNIGKTNVSDSVGGSTGFENRFMPLAYTAAVDAWRNYRNYCKRSV